MRGGWGPSGFDPSQKQSIGVIHIHGIMRSKSAETVPLKGPVPNFGAGGLKQISDKVQFLKEILKLKKIILYLFHTIAILQFQFLFSRKLIWNLL